MDERPGALVVGVDASASARDAAEWAADLAALWDAPLHLLHTVPGWPDDGPVLVPGWLSELVDAAERSGVRTVDAEVVPGSIVDTLLDRAAGARMLVVGSYGDAAWTGLLAGPLAVALIDRAPCPVAVIRGSAPRVPPPRSGPVIVGVDGSDAAGAALALAAELAVSRGSRLVTIHAEDGSDDASVEAQLAGVRMRHPALPMEKRVVDGTALRALGQQVHGASLPVIGWHRFVPGPDVVLGATGRSLVESAPCPVLVVGHPRRALSGSATQTTPLAR